MIRATGDVVGRDVFIYFLLLDVLSFVFPFCHCPTPCVRVKWDWSIGAGRDLNATFYFVLNVGLESWAESFAPTGLSICPLSLL